MIKSKHYLSLLLCLANKATAILYLDLETLVIASTPFKIEVPWCHVLLQVPRF